MAGIVTFRHLRDLQPHTRGEFTAQDVRPDPVKCFMISQLQRLAVQSEPPKSCRPDSLCLGYGGTIQYPLIVSN